MADVNIQLKTQGTNPDNLFPKTKLELVDGLATALSGKSDTTHDHTSLKSNTDNRSTATKPNDYNGVFKIAGLKQNSTLGLNTSTYGNFSGVLGLRCWDNSTGGNSHEIAFAGANGRMLHRFGSTTAWNSSGWKEFAWTSDIPTVDSAMSSTSTNPVQNKVVKSALDGKSDTNHTHSQYLTSVPAADSTTVGGVTIQSYSFEENNYGKINNTPLSATYDYEGTTLSGTVTSVTSSSTVNVAGTGRYLAKLNKQFPYITNGLVVGGTAADGGLYTRGICGVSQPNATTGACNKDHLYINTESNRRLNASRQIVLNSDRLGDQYWSTGVYQYAVPRGDAIYQLINHQIGQINGIPGVLANEYDVIHRGEDPLILSGLPLHIASSHSGLSVNVYQGEIGTNDYINVYIGERTCLMEGTKILMADKTEKNIEDIQPGDEVMSLNPETKELTTSVVLKLDSTGTAEEYDVMIFENGAELYTYGRHRTYINEAGYPIPREECKTGNHAFDSNGDAVRYFKSMKMSVKHEANHYDLLTSNNLYFANGICCGHHPVAKWRAILNLGLKVPDNIKQVYSDEQTMYYDYKTRLLDHDYVLESTTLELDLQEAKDRIAKNKEALSDTDYVTIKHDEGLIDETEWEEHKTARAALRQAINDDQEIVKQKRTQLDTVKFKYDVSREKKYQMFNQCSNAAKQYDAELIEWFRKKEKNQNEDDVL